MSLQLHNPRSLKSPVAILGWGISGRAAASLLERYGLSYLAFDQSGIEGTLKGFDQEQAKRFTTVIYSPGFPQNHPWLKVAHEASCECMSELDLAARFWRGPLVAVTGTNGKTTLTGLLAYALKRAGMGGVAVGNIGTPFSEIFSRHGHEEATAVCEVSSFQAEALRYFKPHALLWTTFAEDHLDRYETERDYFAAKWELVKSLVRPRLFVGKSVVEAAQRHGFKLPGYARVIEPSDCEEYPSDSIFAHAPQNENFALACAYWQSEGYDLNELYEAARLFRLPRYRLERVNSFNGVTFWNDSKATNFSAVEGALNAFSHPPVWIGGGKSKGGDIAGFARKIASRIREALVFGECAPILETHLKKADVRVLRVKHLAAAVEKAFEISQSGDDVLFSPGFASFDQFRDYEDRGKQFEYAVLQLKNLTRPCNNQ